MCTSQTDVVLFVFRSSIHGKGLSRFWSNVEGYHGPLLILLAASSTDSSRDNSGCKQWVIGILTEQGFENLIHFIQESMPGIAAVNLWPAVRACRKTVNFMRPTEYTLPETHVTIGLPKPFVLQVSP